jgi:hypothetical protein
VISHTFVRSTLAGALVACDPSVVTSRAVEQRDPAMHAATTTATPAAAPPRRGRMLAGERVLRDPVWPPADTLAPVRERLPDSLRAAIDRSPVPVLVPGDPDWLARARIHSPAGPHSFGYALSVTHGDRSVTVQASRIATLLPHIGHSRGNRRIRGGEGFYSDNDGIRTASWIEHGVAYSLDLECKDPAGRACSREALEALVDGLAYVGGAGGAP